MPFIPHTQIDIATMLKTIGVTSVEELFSIIPSSLKPKSFNLPKGLSELELTQYFSQLATQNASDTKLFVGGGFYDHYIPAAIDALASRGEFYTAYTPYQAEASQGILQAIFEYQTLVARLSGLDYANASVYDGGSAVYEAAMMAIRHTKREHIIMSESVNPMYRKIFTTIVANFDFTVTTVPHTGTKDDFDNLKKQITSETAAVIVQNPNFFGNVQDFTSLFAHAKSVGAASIISFYPLMQNILKSPAEMGADIATAEGQSLGIPLNFGGPYLGIIACSKALIRQIPGRIVGRTVDAEGTSAYTLTLQAREQHIRRQKATSNICSNQSLCALRAIIYSSLLGAKGLETVATICVERAHTLANKLSQINGIKVINDFFANEFTIILPKNASLIVKILSRQHIAAGIPLGIYYTSMENSLLIACTEKTTPELIDLFVSSIRSACI